MSISPYIMFGGNCREAVAFYAKVFKSDQQEIMTYEQAPADQDYAIPDELKDKVMHTHLMICDTMVMFGDAMPGTPFIVGNNVTLAVVTQNIGDLKDFYSGLQEGGTVSMELQETFFSKYYGAVKDRFGIEWQLVYDDEGTLS